MSRAPDVSPAGELVGLVVILIAFALWTALVLAAGCSIGERQARRAVVHEMEQREGGGW